MPVAIFFGVTFIQVLTIFQINLSFKLFCRSNEPIIQVYLT